jgi:transcriptional regulator with GAF, ATPase, and Fis domain
MPSIQPTSAEDQSPQAELLKNPGAEVMTEAQMRELQKANIVAALKQSNWRVSGPNGAANILDIKPTTLADRIRSFEIVKPSRR